MSGGQKLTATLSILLVDVSSVKEPESLTTPSLALFFHSMLVVLWHGFEFQFLSFCFVGKPHA